MPDNPYGPPPPAYKEPGMPYEFSYGVKDAYAGNDFGHEEISDGKVTSGSYKVLLPDGRTQIVSFTADHENGFQAQVSYEGEIKAYAPAPAYKPAPAPYEPAPYEPAPYEPAPPAYE